MLFVQETQSTVEPRNNDSLALHDWYFHNKQQLDAPVIMHLASCSAAAKLLKHPRLSRWLIRTAVSSPSLSSSSPSFPSPQSARNNTPRVYGKVGGAVALMVLVLVLVLVFPSGERLRLVELAAELNKPV